MASSRRVILPEDVMPLVTQVAGHTCEKDKCSPGLMKHKDGYVLKPLLKPVQARNEVGFYEGLASAPHAALMPFVPHFYGTGSISMESYVGEVLILEDISGHLQKPCIMDVKIGRQTWDPLATPLKIQSEETKYIESKRALGFCIPGFQVYDSETGELRKFEKSYGKSLNGKTIFNAFSTFLNLQNRDTAKVVIDEYISKLQMIFDIISQQKSLHLYSSSILLTYDYAQISSHMDTSSWAHVHLIDFAHAFTGASHEQGTDTNYLQGLRNLIEVLTSLKS